MNLSAHAKHTQQHFAKMNANKDGKIEQAARDAMKAKLTEHHNKSDVKPEAK